jgi:hypothetical protein
MSLGGAIGGLVGGVIGFMVGGPAGAYTGFSLGLGLGMMIDPITPDIAKPDTQELSAPTSTEGSIIADVLGTTQISQAATFIWYGNNRSEEQTETAGGKGGGSEYVTGYQYFLSFAIGICLGPADAICAIWEGDTLLWPAMDGGEITIDDATDGYVELTVTGRGTIDFYFGTDDQSANSVMGTATGYSLPLRGLCYAVFNDFMIGSYNRVGSLKFVVRKRPSDPFNANHEIGTYDINPIHALRYIIAERCGIDEAYVDDDEFSDVADVLYSDSRGISALFKQENSCVNYLESILSHVRGVMRLSDDGKIQPVLLRNDVDTGDMITINDDDILEDVAISRPGMSNLDNQINASYSIIEDISDE